MALQAKQEELDQAHGEQQATASTAAELAEQCEALKRERSHLMKEKGELLAEIAKQAGHLNHKQKIQYVSKLKKENDDLRRQLREAVDGKASVKPNVPAKTVAVKAPGRALAGSQGKENNGRPATVGARS